jgi:hypothetical protein
MNEHQPSPETGWHIQPSISLDQLTVTDDDPAILALWDEGLSRWGEAFAGYTTLGKPELHTVDVLSHFERFHIVSLDTIEEVLEDDLRRFGWEPALRQFRRDQSIPEDLLVWNKEAMIRWFGQFYDIVESGGRVHVFSK